MLIDDIEETTADTVLEALDALAALELTPDMLLQASRRVDWRFLLPNPTLGRVAYVGPVDSEHAASLRLFCQTFIAIQPDWSPEAYQQAKESFDVVVVERPSSKTLPTLATLVRPGGYIYLELYGSSWSAKKQVKQRKLRVKGLNKLRPNRFDKPLELAGFVNTTTHWHWPDFEGCTKIIPLGSQTAVHFALANEKKGVKARLQALFSEQLNQAGLLPQLVPCYSVLAQRWG